MKYTGVSGKGSEFGPGKYGVKEMEKTIPGNRWGRKEEKWRERMEREKSGKIAPNDFRPLPP